VRHSVRFGQRAKDDLLALYDHRAAEAGPDRALGYATQVEHVCLGLAAFPHRGAPRTSVRPGLRVLAFRRRVSVVYVVSDREIIVLRILYGGRRVNDEELGPA
jgi:toxin ParE1/3/4